MLFIFYTYAIAWFIIICGSYDFWKTWTERELAAGNTKPTWNLIKTFPHRANKFMLEFGEDFWSGM